MRSNDRSVAIRDSRHDRLAGASRIGHYRRLVARAAPKSRGTLADVVLVKGKPRMAERGWSRLVRAVAAKDQAALHALYDRAHRIVFTLAMRIVRDRATAEEITLDVFHDVWRYAAAYGRENGTVVAWIMNLARSRSIDRLRYEQRKKRYAGGRERVGDAYAASTRDVVESEADARALRAGLAMLTPNERLVIEAVFVAGLTHVEAAARLKEPLGTVKSRARSGLRKLRRAMRTSR